MSVTVLRRIRSSSTYYLIIMFLAFFFVLAIFRVLFYFLLSPKGNWGYHAKYFYCFYHKYPVISFLESYIMVFKKFKKKIAKICNQLTVTAINLRQPEVKLKCRFVLFLNFLENGSHFLLENSIKDTSKSEYRWASGVRNFST